MERNINRLEEKMNLLKDSWLPIIRLDGAKENVSFYDLVDQYSENPIVDIDVVRSDFHNTLYQLIIGIVQVAAAPEDSEDWLELWSDPYSSEELREKLQKIESFFDLDSDGPAFMQDFNMDMSKAKKNELSNLFINLPANEHYSKTAPKKIGPYWAAVALYTLQTLAPSGGRGHRVGIRGGGPLTTMILPCDSDSPLWNKIWINIISEDKFSHNDNDSNLFPWMQETKSSTKNETVYPIECHPHYVFFGMPRRIRLIFENITETCDLTGEECDKIAVGYNSLPYGNNYGGFWRHPLNAYYQKDDDLISVKAQSGGIGYRHWQGLVSNKDENIARVVYDALDSNAKRSILRRKPMRLFVAGYDMDNMKAKCWYESEMPIYDIEQKNIDELNDLIKLFVTQAGKMAVSTSKCVDDAGGCNKSIVSMFWKETELSFYEILNDIMKKMDKSESLSSCKHQWSNVLESKSLELFKKTSLNQKHSSESMGNLVRANKKLNSAIKSMKSIFNN